MNISWGKQLLNQWSGDLQSMSQVLALPELMKRNGRTFDSSGFRMPMETNDVEVWNADQNYLNSAESLFCRGLQIPRRFPQGERWIFLGKPVGLLYPTRKSSRWYGSFLTLKPAKHWLLHRRGLQEEEFSCDVSIWDWQRAGWYVLVSCCVYCGPWTPATMASPGCLIIMQNLSPNPDLLNQNKDFNIPRWPMDTLKFEKSIDSETTISPLTYGIITTKLD